MNHINLWGKDDGLMHNQFDADTRRHALPEIGKGGVTAAFVVFAGMCLTPVFKAPSVLVALIAGGFQAVSARQVALKVAPVLPLMALPLWALLSTVWSDDPLGTSRYATQFCATILITLILVRTIDARSLLGALLLATLGTAIVGFLVGYTDIATDRPLHGGMGSKNFMASYGSLLCLASLAVGFDRWQSSAMRLIAAVAFVTGVIVLALTESAAAWISTIGGAIFLGLLGASAALPKVARGAALIVFLVSAPVLWLNAPPHLVDEIYQGALEATGKDPTLTGRTQLWARAEPLISERPVLGLGYKAFWRRGGVEAEGLLRMLNIPLGAGFNFHNQYLDLMVELGIVGMALFVITALVGGARLISRAIASANLAVCFFAAAWFAMLVRTPVEAALVGAFNIFPMIFFAACCVGVTPQGDELPLHDGARP